MYNFQITALCISFLYARCGKITFLRQSRPHRACLPPDKAAYIFSIHLGFHCGEYNTQRDTVYHIWSVCPSYFQLTVLFISFAGTGFMEQGGGAFLGFAVQPCRAHPPSSHNIFGKKTPYCIPGTMWVQKGSQLLGQRSNEIFRVPGPMIRLKRLPKPVALTGSSDPSPLLGVLFFFF